jgi:phosphomannomutase
MSGHICVKEHWYDFDDGTYADCRLFEIVSQSPDANAVLHALPTGFSTPELNVACAKGEPHSVTAALQALAGDAFKPPAQVSAIDGLRVDRSDGFGLIRASNTTLCLCRDSKVKPPRCCNALKAICCHYCIRLSLRPTRRLGPL